MAFPAHFLDQIRDQVGLSQIVGKKTQLNVRGREHVGLCPFHNEKTPSFTVNEDKGFYHCFGCGEHGSVFDFVMKTDNLSFPEAVENLAMEAGLELPETSREEREWNKNSKTLYDLVEKACIYFQEQLWGPLGTDALKYLNGRGIRKNTIEKFRLGFAPNKSGKLTKILTDSGFTQEQIINAGILVLADERERSRYERFRNRVIFPIIDIKNRVIGFGGRILGDGTPKYLNSPETALFHKGKSLYALNLASKVARKKNEVIVAEGYTDVIALHQSGFDTAVAPLGTALTDEQIKLLWRFAREPILCFDGDMAGQRAAIRAAERCLPHLKPGYTMKFAILPEGEDPDDFIRSQGVDAMRRIFANGQSLSEIIWVLETKRYTLETPEDRAWLEDRIKKRLTNITDLTVRRHYLTSFKERLWNKFRGTSHNQFEQYGMSDKKYDHLAKQTGFSNQLDTTILGEAILIFTLINHPGLFDQVGESLGTVEFSDVDLDKLRQEVLKTLSSFESSGLELKAATIRKHLVSSGFSSILDGPFRQEVANHARFSDLDQEIGDAKIGWEQQFRIFMREKMLEEIEATKERLKKDLNRTDFELLKALKQSVGEIEDADKPTDLISENIQKLNIGGR